MTGAPPAFCAGADLADVESDDFVATLAEVLTGFGELPFVTIAAVEGAALGAGTQLAIACDLRVATAPSQFGIPAARLGLAVDAWTVQRLVQEMGASVARAMLLAAQTYSGEHLAEVGAVHRIGDLQRALAWADELGGLAPLTIRAHKLAMERALAARPLTTWWRRPARRRGPRPTSPRAAARSWRSAARSSVASRPRPVALRLRGSLRTKLEPNRALRSIDQW
ncbi:MAG: enoyl-CoA hydratase/isomerase family protein [Actinomycetota bacterium]|nr:MAG: enoyl-CoA hydratase/isomerase family protein [Actinomycetota bacterium]